ELESAVRALLDLLREFADEPVAKIAGIDGSAGKLVGYLERGRALREGPRAGERDGNGGDGTCDEAPARDIHGFLLRRIAATRPAHRHGRCCCIYKDIFSLGHSVTTR